jgi:hypothetical protein
LKLPFSSLLNYKTVVKHHPGLEHLSAYQLLSYHLAIHRREVQSPSSSHADNEEDNPFGPFIASLPRSFDTIPLWLAHTSRDDDRASVSSSSREKWEKLSSCMPRSLKAKTDDVERRFHDAWKHVFEATVRSDFKQCKIRPEWQV